MLTTCHLIEYRIISTGSKLFPPSPSSYGTCAINLYLVYLYSVGMHYDGQDRYKGWISFSHHFSGRLCKKNRLHACLQCDIRNEHWDSFLEIQFYAFCIKRILRKRTCSPPFLLLWFQNFEMYTFFFRTLSAFHFFYTFPCFFYPILFKNFHQKLVACKSFFPTTPPSLFFFRGNLISRE